MEGIKHPDLDHISRLGHLVWIFPYIAVAMVLIFPFDIFYLSSRYFLLRTLWRIVLPFQVISDLERSACRMVHRQVATIAWLEADSVCGSRSIAIPLVLVFPYICRLFQRLRQFKDTKERTTLFNALKYSTAVPVVFLPVLKYHVFPDRWTNLYCPLWLLFSVVNSLYSFYCDIAREWDFEWFLPDFQVQQIEQTLQHVLRTKMGIFLGNWKQLEIL